MSDMYCEYSGLKYKIKKRNDEYIITSRVRDEGFTNYIDVLGEEIEAIKLVKKPVLDFKYINQSEEILEYDALDKWLSELV